MSSRPAWFYSETLKEKNSKQTKNKKWELTSNFLCVHACTCAYKHVEARGQPCVSFSRSAYIVIITIVLVRQGLSMTRKCKKARLKGQRALRIPLSLPAQCRDWECHHTQLFQKQNETNKNTPSILGFDLRSSYFQCKHLTSWNGSILHLQSSLMMKINTVFQFIF